MEFRTERQQQQRARFGVRNGRSGRTLKALGLRLKPRNHYSSVQPQRHRSSLDTLTTDFGRGAKTAPPPAVIEERNRLAREIHDTVVQEFAGILLHLEAA